IRLPNPPAGIVSSLEKKPVVRVEADVGAAIHRRRVEKRPKVPRISRRHRFREDDLGVSAIARARSALYSARSLLMSRTSSLTEAKLPFRTHSVRSAKKRSTKLSQDDEIGVKCMWKHGCCVSHVCTFLWVA